MSIRLFRGRLTVDLLLLPAVALLIYIYGAKVCISFSLALALHEFAHALAARAVGARIYSIELLPFGCAARLEGLGELSGGKEAAVAAAGPLAGMALAAGANMLAGQSAFLGEFAKASLGLSAINLVPVPPLDGGRIFCALLGLALPRQRAQRAAAVLGICFGGALICLFVYLTVTGSMNVTPAVMGVFMITSSVRRLKSEELAFASRLIKRRAAVKRQTVLDVRHIAASEDRKPSELLTRLDPRRYNIIHIVDGSMRTVRTIDEGELLDELLGGTEQNTEK